jgi:hypothetical protein
MRDNITQCPDAVLGLRRQAQCALLPAFCRDRPEFRESFLDLCDPRRFYLPERTQTVLIAGKQLSGGAGTVTTSTALNVALATVTTLVASVGLSRL